jgi:hypothetical protein
MLAPRAFFGGAAVIMARKRKTAQERLRQAIEQARGPHLRDLLPKTDYSDNRAREIGANIALTLTNHAHDAPLRLAFEAFQLDPSDPHNWRILLNDLSGVLFERPAGNPRGARPKWEEHRRMLFRTHVAMARKRLKEITSRSPADDLVADYLRYKWSNLYQQIAAASLRKYIATKPPQGRR